MPIVEQLRLRQALDLVKRERAARGTWGITQRTETAAVFAAARLATTVSRDRATATAEDQARWQEFPDGDAADRPNRDQAEAK